MASGDDQNRDEGDSEFGPPVSGFGPPLNDFGPPTGDFGPPMGDFGPPTGDSAGVGWSPVGELDRPTVGWQPADAPVAPPVPPPPPQYRAPDSTTAPEPPRAPAPETRRVPGPDQHRGPEAARGSEETVRFSDSGSRRPSAPADTEGGSWWNSDDSGFPPTPPRDKPTSLWDDDELAKKLTAPRPGNEPKAGSGSLWDDDDLAKKLAPARPAAGPEPEEHHRNRGVLFGGIGAAVVLVVALILVVVFATRGGGGDDDPTAAAGTTAADGSCVTRTEGPIVYGNGPGDTSSGANAIFGYEHAYYTERSAEKAHTFVAPDANVQPVPELQKTIAEHVPAGTTYCLRIASAGANQYSVEVTEHHPDNSRAVYLELIATVNQGGKYLIQLIQ
ncbi:hypothetical protein AB0L57_25280 [Nocardia sp. NPDC052254]|uniref:hypothetical protein n=1 Tax=Nocardia sp. NPDC052254 TaxID=3155681 RepID=UPI00342265D9